MSKDCHDCHWFMDGSKYLDCAKATNIFYGREKVRKGLIGMCEDWSEIGFNKKTKKVYKNGNN